MFLVISHSASTSSAVMWGLVQNDTRMLKMAPKVMATQLPRSIGNSCPVFLTKCSGARPPGNCEA